LEVSVEVEVVLHKNSLAKIARTAKVGM
jgi:hypothetical protein